MSLLNRGSPARARGGQGRPERGRGATAGGWRGRRHPLDYPAGMDAMTVSPAVPGDAVAIAGLLRELDDFYDAPFRESAEAKAASVTSVLFGDPARAFALVARDGAALAGI